MPGISLITITAGPRPAMSTFFVTPSSVIARRSKSSRGSSWDSVTMRVCSAKVWN
jgi:hypothetical protein